MIGAQVEDLTETTGDAIAILDPATIDDVRNAP